MPRLYKPKNGFSRRVKLDQNKLKQAVSTVLGGQPLKTTARLFDLPIMTLKRYCRKKSAAGTEIQYGPVYGLSSRAFTDEEEEMLTAYVIKASKMNFGLTPSNVRLLAYQFAVANNKPIAQKWQKGETASYDWYYGFMCRHKCLSLRKAQATSLSRSTAFNRHNVGKFYGNLQSIQKRYNFDAKDTWNLDETGTTTVQDPEGVVAETGTKQVSKATSGERGETVTSCCAINAAGGFIPPFMIFPRKNWQPRMLNNAYPGTAGVTHPSGWMTTENFVKFLQHFKKHTRYSVEHPCLMVMDNHDSHISVDAIQFAKDNGIHLLTIPPHTSHKLQPLDRCVYSPFKIYFNREADNWMSRRGVKTISIYEIAEFTNAAFTKAFTPQNIRSSFAVTGIWPFNSELFTDADFLPSSVTDRPDPNVPQASPEVGESGVGDVQEDPQEEQQQVDAAEQNVSEKPDKKAAAVPSPKPGQRIRRKPARFLSIDETEPPKKKPKQFPATAIKQEPLEVSHTPKTPNVKMEPSADPMKTKTPEEIRPFPKASPRKGTRKGRKRGETQILTDTPVKAKIEEIHQIKQEKLMKKQLNKDKKVRRKL